MVAMDANERARDERATINVGGTVYEVAVSTIMNYPETMLGALLSTRWKQSGSG